MATLTKKKAKATTAITVDRKLFVDLVQKASKFVPRRASRPSLGNVLITFSATTISASACSEDQFYRTVMTNECWSDDQGNKSLLADPSKLLSLLSSLNHPDVAIDLGAMDGDEYSIKIRAGKGKYSIQCMNSADFDEFTSAFTSTDADNSIELNGKAFAESIKAIFHATGTDETKQILTAINVILNPDSDANDLGVIELCGTDGHRMAIMKSDNVASGCAERMQFNIPLKSATKIESCLLGKDDQKIHLSVGGGLVVMNSESSDLMFRMIEGAYPNYNQLVPGTFANTITVDAGSACDAIARAAAFSHNTVVHLQVTDNNSLAIYNPTLENVDSAYEEIDAESSWTSTEVYKFAFTAKYILDALKHAASRADDGKVEINLNAATSPAVMSPSTNSDASVSRDINLVMPVQIREA